MLGSKSTYFLQDPDTLKNCRIDFVLYMKSQRYDMPKREVYLKAFDYFCQNPSKYDGATFVKDLCHIPGLDINAMLHDYHCVVYNIAADYYTKWKGDWLYAKEMERTGRGQLSWVNFFLLKLIGTLHLMYANYKRGYITGQQMINFEKDYRILM